MKTPEDEAFDDLARKQGAWGGGFPAKRAMAADKLQEPDWKTMPKKDAPLINWAKNQTPPQRERVVFPTMLRKMWSGGEVQAWLDENVNKEKNT